MPQTPSTRDRRTARAGLLGGIVLVTLVGQLLLLPSGDGLARLSYDLPFRFMPRDVPSELVLVYLDPKVKTILRQSPEAPLDRRFYVDLLDKLTADGARLVLFDLIFDSPHPDPATDRQFAAAMRRHGRVVLVGYMVKHFRETAFVTAPVPPTPVLADAADYFVRRLDVGTVDWPSVDLVAARILNPGLTNLWSGAETRPWIKYYCSPLDLVAIPLDHVLSNDVIEPGFFRDKIVLVGNRPGSGGLAGSEREEFGTPYSRFDGAYASGPSIHAISLLNLYRGDWMQRLSLGTEIVLVLIWGILISTALLRLRPLSAVLAGMAVVGLFAFVAIWIQASQLTWFNWLVPAGAQTSLALLWSVGFQFGVESRRRRKLRRAFAAYLSPHMADRISDSDVDVGLGGKEVHATVMFTDLEGFTSMTEKMPPAEVSRILIAYFNATTRAILEKDGTIIKYMGDAVMAVWGAPLAHPRAAQTAVLAALGMRQAGNEEIAGRRFRTRIGLNSGMVLAGNLGSEFRFDYTLIGETTNVASRLESLNKYFGTDILISESTRRELDDEIALRLLGWVVVAGTTRPLALYEVLGLAVEFQPPPTWLGQFIAALDHFTRRELDAAETLFGKVSEQRGLPDGPSNFYLKEIARERAKAPTDATWDGVIRFESK
jgi:adenylate cyclase